MSSQPSQPPSKHGHKLDDLLRGAAAGDAEARQELFDEYAHHFRWLIRRKLKHRLRSLFDSEDFMQRTRMVLLQRELEQSIFSSPEAFTAYLCRAAENIVNEANRQQTGEQKRDLGREVALEAPCVNPEKDLVSSETGPLETAEANDEWDRLLRACPQRERGILVLLRQGYSHAETAARLGLNERTIRRLIERLRESQS